MGFLRQEYWSGLPCPSPGDLLTQGLNLGVLHRRWILHLLSHREDNQCSNAFVDLGRGLRAESTGISKAVISGLTSVTLF